jgi:hypothetical protein
VRTQSEILERMKQVEDSDFFGAIRSDLLIFLEFENAKPFLKDGVTKEQWEEVRKEATEENVKKEMADYLDFAFEKAKSERGLSSGRSMDHYSAWIWLLNAESHFGDVRKYSSYGIHHLNRIKEYLD